MFNKPIEYKILDNGCWICISHAELSSGGHPCKVIAGKAIRIQNIIYEKYKTVIPTGMTAYNICGTPACINPEHLQLGILGKNYHIKSRPITYRIDENGCWICTSHKPNCRGYPKGSFFISHIMYEKYKGDIPEGMSVLHKCDVRMCINPEHLWLGTIVDNNMDRHKKGRDAIVAGELNGNAKLTEQDVIEIRNSDKSIKELCIQFNVDGPAIYKIIKRINWKHI
jgi:hypothetical protein